MRKCFADDSKICDCQPTAGRICEGVVALRKYANRYRWLRASANLDGPHIYGPDGDWILDGEEADSAVDAAMAARPTVG